MVLSKGETVPDFTLMGVQDGEMQPYTLSEYAADKPVLLTFYVYDFSPICTDQMCEVDDAEFLTLNDDVRVLGVSGDGLYSHEEFAGQNMISYPLLTDDTREAYSKCELLKDTEDGVQEPTRGMLLIDSELTVRDSWEAESNWDEWDVAVLSEMVERAREIESV